MTNAPQTVTPEHTAIGWIGTGVMGLSMCGHLMQAGYRVTLHSRILSPFDLHEWNDLQNRGLSILAAHFADDPGGVPKSPGKSFL